MLTSNGSLTDIGAWYLGEQGMGNIPDSGVKAKTTTKAAPTPTYTMPALVTQRGGAEGVRLGRTWMAVALGVSVLAGLDFFP